MTPNEKGLSVRRHALLSSRRFGLLLSPLQPGALATNFVVTVTPDTIVKGDTVSTVFEFDLSEEIAAGSVSYSGTYNGLPFSQSAELCAEVSKTGESCPLKAGHHYEVSKAVADYTGKLDTTIEWKAADGRQILCAKVVTKVA